MPNWVSNRIDVSAENQQDLAEFVAHIKKVPTFYKFASDTAEVMGDEDFSFHSFITLDKDKEEEYNTTNGFGPEGKTGDTEFNWYNWNTNNWGTKWDAASVSVEVAAHAVGISFETAWASPDPVFIAMSEQFPKLTFDIWWEEEQGYGAQLSISNGLGTMIKSWDIPESHQDYIDQSKEDSCICQYFENTEDWYEDCPGKKPAPIHIIEVVHRFEVQAREEADAIEAVKAHENNFDIKSGIEIVSYEYNADYRHVGHKELQEQEG
jgi:hypothetical protein